MIQKLILLLLVIVLVHKNFAQIPELEKQPPQNPSDSIPAKAPEKDMGDVFNHLFHRHAPVLPDTGLKKDTRKHFSIVPAVGYTLQTGFAGIISANMAWYTDTAKDTKISSITTNLTYSQKKQVLIPFQINSWTKGNRYNIITDFRFIKYPSVIYGLGGEADPNQGITIDYSAIKVHQTVMKALGHNFYVGLGYYFDKLWNIKPIDSLSDNLKDQLTNKLGTTETASGVVFRLLYDTRLNQINPQQGLYFNVAYRYNPKAFGSDSTWHSVLIDARKYLHFPQNSKNVLAFWWMEWFVTGGTSPYLLMPSTGWDDTYNTGRGYIQGRFRGKTMSYFETEYRFGITNNGLIGGVAFINLQHFSDDISSAYNKVFPGYGVGLRIKLNKVSGANLCIDYGFGQNGSRGFFVNLGELF
ncbi:MULTISPECIES: BamA/TamA family outer membrane protein [Niastella]|uniref:BamA/TamA family outer membrane protein n=1 Tax=Niastella soli TaxID=2821487 RepID=A0ABS3Z5L6_9BACT|nr:BamA/TamA family outer membrane protein [Niastella soli]MBO9205429.1 BamA/TamA family outer membrane protein [Niastella soli]